MNNKDVQKPNILLEVKNLKKHFPRTSGFLNRVYGYIKAVDDVSFSLKKGEVLGLVGESGCGKTTLGRCLLRVYNLTSGEVIYYKENDSKINLSNVNEQELKNYRKDVRMIFQDPQSSLNPRLTILQVIGEPLIINKNMRGKKLENRVRELLKMVGLRPEYINRYPHSFSGGERQRIGIARALALDPTIIIADEPVSALDVSVQAQVLNLLEELKEKLELTYIFIAHDLSVVKHISDRIAVMYVGKMVEITNKNNLFKSPRHPYSEALLSSVPITDPQLRKEKIRLSLKGEVADPASPPQGCYFHPRCKYVKEECLREIPGLNKIEEGHKVACCRSKELDLKGVKTSEKIAK